MNQDPITIKILVVGDGSVGKTCILLSYTTDKFPTEYVPTVFENYSTQVKVDNKQVNVSLWDTAGQETYGNLRTLSYENTDVFLIIFSVTEQSSFENSLNKWYPELNKDKLQSAPKLFVGNKIDMRSDTNANHIKQQTAKQVLSAQGCQYFECSALTQEGLKPLFDEAIKLAVQKKMAEMGGGTSQKPSKPAQNNSQCCSLV